MDGSIAFAKWCQTALWWRHTGAAGRIQLNLCFLPQLKRQINRFSHFCTAHGRKSLYFIVGAPIPKIAIAHGDLNPHLIYDSLGHSTSPQRNWHHHRFSHFCTDDRRVSIYFTTSGPFNSNCPFSQGDLDSDLTHGSLGPPKSSTQKASWLVQPFLQGSLVWQKDRPTDHTTWSVTIGRIYAA